MKELQKSLLCIEDSTTKEYFYNIKELNTTNRCYLPSINDVVILPYSSAMNGFIYNKNQSYFVKEIKNDFICGVLYMLLKRIEK